MEKELLDDVIQYNDELIGKSTKPVAAPERSIGMDVNNSLFNNIIKQGVSSTVNLSEFESFTSVAQNRNQLYDMIDDMCMDSTIATILEMYSEDATEYNPSGRIVWCEAADVNVQHFVEYLLDTINVDKNVYKWTNNLIKYGDVYFRLYHESEYEDELFSNFKINDKRQALNEDKSLDESVKLVAFSPNDKLVHHLEMVPNPAEVFELTKFGKTFGYVKSKVQTQPTTQEAIYMGTLNKYNFDRGDIDVYSATDFVHASLEDNNDRNPETVSINMGNGEDGKPKVLTYTVKRGQSIFSNVFKIWRELTLLENSVMLNRVTKSSIVRLVNVEVGDMPKEAIGPHLQHIKGMIEQKAAINVGNSMNDYTAPGPVENNVYIPTHDGKGVITTEQIGGDVDVKGLADLDYFKDKFYSAIGIPKQFLGDTNDAAGFSGGESLSLISSRYAKTIKRIQNTICQALTDAINIMLLDKHLDTYVNAFTIRMQAPTTKEENDRRENIASQVNTVQDIYNLLSDIEQPTAKLEILKDLLSNVLVDSAIPSIIQDEIDRLQKQIESEEVNPEEEPADLEMNFDETVDLPGSHFRGSEDTNTAFSNPEASNFEVSSNSSIEPEPATELPSPSELGQDFTNI